MGNTYIVVLASYGSNLKVDQCSTFKTCVIHVLQRHCTGYQTLWNELRIALGIRTVMST